MSLTELRGELGVLESENFEVLDITDTEQLLNGSTSTATSCLCSTTSCCSCSTSSCCSTSCSTGSTSSCA